VHRQIVVVGPAGDRLDFFQGVDPAAAAVVGIFQANQAGTDQVLVVGMDLAFELAQVEDAVVAREGPAGHAAVDRGAAGLVQVDVAVGIAEQFVARLGVGLDANLVGHRS
jgi:hypothetical protein